KRIKIAILDSGLDKEHNDIRSARERIRVFDRSEKDPHKPRFKKLNHAAISDSVGHGTHVVGLILEYTSDAELYVADVNVDKQPDREPHAYCDQAITCAVDAGADVISISVGFEERELPDPLEQAIKYAKDKEVHVFAAASNQGANRRRTYPARYDGVFCIHSTNAFGDFCDFNPTKLGDCNFATMGVAVTSSWPKNLAQSPESYEGGSVTKAMTGTSVSTPIAASLAAFLLRYARTHLDHEHIVQLKKHSVLRSVLKSMAQERDRVFYLSLQSAPGHMFGWHEADIQREMKKVIHDSD
ncbi:subtilisin-like protein, partial [Macroventuria anomochaeta]